MSRYWSALVHRLQPYVPGEQPALTNPVKLNTNENPYGPSPRVVAAIQRELSGTSGAAALGECTPGESTPGESTLGESTPGESTPGESLRRYPDPTSRQLRATLARYYGLAPEQIFVGNGSDEVLAHIFAGLLKQDNPTLFPDIGYSFYPTYCRLYDINYRTIPLDADFSIDLEHYLEDCGAGPNGGIVFANPNAPTGRLLPLSAIERLLQVNRDSVVVVDEAYIDFGGVSAVPLIHRYPNLLVVQTLSKSRSLAGMRVGLALGDSELITALTRLKDSFNSYPLDRLAQVAAIAAYEDQEWFDTTRQAVIGSRVRLTGKLEALGFNVLPSAANFVFARHPLHDAATLSRGLREQGIFVRHFDAPRIAQFLRISIGSEAECNSLLQALAKLTQI